MSHNISFPSLSTVMELESVLMFEVSALSWQHISISLEHPVDESMATVELDLADPAAPRASLYTLNSPPRDHIDDYITKVLQKSHSIPVTLRYVLTSIQSMRYPSSHRFEI